ncbi:MAG: hypothetical protein A3F16_07660 [Deltaproteobacteria bacterium RIFCSPHIGHO2_12_FULL_43_9]|nr:MAG: hypothetical protein A3F16_07660 [Deltaproteobacteria bacterium RIFCSPHIGHO2_12_FULL_43_9]
MRHSKHYWRAAFIVIGIFIIALIVRTIIYPKSFGVFGHYRGDAVTEQMNQPIVFAAPGACNTCHADIAKIHGEKSHKSVQCQNCHEPLVVHVEDGNLVGDMPINRSPKLCLRCHRLLPSRPEGFPQIVAEEHVGKNEQDLEEGACKVCHSAHAPSLK